ncbi:MAG: glycosyltransferase family 4 protein [Candidatus Omnitrophica bacterium]|nr:glycosyltransferase family 4 protein [Candidatus Omnitrophota bacterium]
MKIALILNDDFSMLHFRKGLISFLKSKGHEVFAITPDGPYVAAIRGLGATHISIPGARFIDPWNDLKLLFRLYAICTREKFDIVHTMTIKPNIYGTIAARLTGVKRVVGLVSGAGAMFSDGLSPALRLMRPIIFLMYRFAFFFSDGVWFQNEEDARFFAAKKILPAKKAVVIKGGGIDTEEFSPDSLDKRALEEKKKELGVEKKDAIVSMVIARMVWSKGVREFIEAAEMAGRKHANAAFLLVGPVEKNSPDSVPEDYLKERSGGVVRPVIGFRTDVKEIIALSDIVALPSYYREGVPRVLLEGLSLGKPVVTTDSIGCRETVDQGINGYLVPPRDPVALAEAFDKLLSSKNAREEFGARSRMKAQREFEQELTAQKVADQLYRIK